MHLVWCCTAVVRPLLRAQHEDARSAVGCCGGWRARPRTRSRASICLASAGVISAARATKVGTELFSPPSKPPSCLCVKNQNYKTSAGETGKPPHTSDGAHTHPDEPTAHRSAQARPQKPRTQQLPTPPQHSLSLDPLSTHQSTQNSIKFAAIVNRSFKGGPTHTDTLQAHTVPRRPHCRARKVRFKRRAL